VNDVDYGPPRDPGEVDRHLDILAWSFAIPREDLVEFFARAGSEKIRVLREAGRPVAGLTLLPMGQFFGGRSVPMTGVNLVGSAPEARGRGAATRLMRACVREMRDGGVPVSTLYPAKQTLYRRAGWEVAGARWELSVNARDLDAATRELDLRPVEDADLPAVRALYRRIASGYDGPVDRSDFLWRRVVDPFKRVVQGFLVEGADGPEGYVYLHVSRGDGMRQELQVTDLVAATASGARRLLGFLADHDSLADRIVWHGNPADPLLGQVAEHVWRARLFFPWMLRILDPKAALEARGYAPGLAAALHFELEDPDLPENSGRFVLEVEDARGRVRPGGEGRIRARARGLAAIYGGWTTPAAARAQGLLDAPADALARAAPVFAGPVSWMSDMF
jgi:predicted acetyltransferase